MPVFGQGDTQLDVFGSRVTWMALQLGCAEPEAAVPFDRAAETVRGAFDDGAAEAGIKDKRGMPGIHGAIIVHVPPGWTGRPERWG